MYLEYFNFSEAPFTIAPDPHFVYMSSRHQEGLAHLLYGINQGGGFVALTGEVGTGKTTLCRCLLQELPDEVDLALVLNPKLSGVELLATICDELSIEYDKFRQTLKHLVDALNRHLLDAHAKGRRTILMIDEAQNLSFSVLEQVRLLTNLETSKDKLLQIILVGQPELQDLLASPQLRQLNQRITARYHLLPLKRSETAEYIRHRLIVSRGDPAIFNRSAIRLIHRLSGGIPRLINLICDRSLLGAYVGNSRRVTPAIAWQAAREIDNLLVNRPLRKRRRLLLTALAASAAAAGYYHWPALVAYVAPHSEPIESVSSATVYQPPVSVPLPAEAVEPAPPIESERSDEKPVEAETLSLHDYLQQPELTLQQAFASLLDIWNLPPAVPEQCDQLTAKCLAGRAEWRKLTALNRPAILEFSVADEQKSHLLLVAVESDGRPLFRDRGSDIRFPLHEVLNMWEGYFLLLWQPPQAIDGVISPGQKTPAVVWLRNRLDAQQGFAGPDNAAKDVFDGTLRRRVETFQRTQRLLDDGIAGPHTIIHLQNLSSEDDSPRLFLSD